MPTKPKCGKGQSCGDSCISAADTCQDTLSDDSVILLLSLSKATGGPANIKGAYAAAASQSAASSARTSNFVNPGDRDLSFDQLQAKYPMKAGVANDQVDLGNGWSRWDISHRASDGSGDIMSYSVLQAPGGKYFVQSDGPDPIKEVTDSGKQAHWKEGRDAALRQIAAENDDLKQQAAAQARLKAAQAATAPDPALVAARLANALPIDPSVVKTNSANLAKYEAQAAKDYGQQAVADVQANVKRILNDDDTQVYVRISSTDVVDKILSGGRMRTSAELGITDHQIPGLPDSNYQTARNRVEAYVMGVDAKTKPEDRPIYGYLGSKSESQLDGDSHKDVGAYGGVTIRLRSDAKDRSTFTGADSFKSGIASKVTDPSAASVLPVSKFGYDLDDPNVPGFARGPAKAQAGANMRLAAKAKTLGELNALAPTGANYLEAQVHGGVRATDIEELNFQPKNHKDFPSDEVISKAHSLGITVAIHGKAIDPKEHAAKVASMTPEGRQIKQGMAEFMRTGKLDSDTLDAVARLADSASRNKDPGASVDPELYTVTQALGFHEKPKMGSRRDIDALVADGATMTVRGVQASGGKTAQEVADLFSQGDYFVGKGIYGHGTYVGHSGQFYDGGRRRKQDPPTGQETETFVPGGKSQADIDTAWSGPVSNGYIDDTSANIRAALSATARVATQGTLERERYKAAKAIDREIKAAIKAGDAKREEKLKRTKSVLGLEAVSDTDSAVLTRFAAAMGYDAVALNRSYEPTNFMVVLNRGAMTVQKGPVPIYRPT